VALAILIPFTALGRWFGFVAPPPALLAALAVMLVCYLVLAEVVKRWFYRHRPPERPSRAWVRGRFG
jgi:Mg2+-importing ATPase